MRITFFLNIINIEKGSRKNTINFLDILNARYSCIKKFSKKSLDLNLLICLGFNTRYPSLIFEKKKHNSSS